MRGSIASLSAAIRLGLGGVVFAVPFLAYATDILHAFYIRGSSFYDAGWSAYLIHDADLQVHNPSCVNGGVSWFNFHISPLFLLTSAIGHLLPLSRIQFYAAYVGISHALPAVAVFWLLLSGYGMRTAPSAAFAALVAWFFAFDGLAQAIARFPHFTMFLVGTGMIFLVALVLCRFAVALLFFLLCLATREDAGLHLFALLSLAFVVECWRGGGAAELKPIAIFAAAALFYSIVVTTLQHAFSNDESLLVSEYLGRPAFAHITLSLLLMRAIGWLEYRPYVVLPAIVALLWAIARRNPQIVLGYAAFVPWGMLHLTAARDLQATLPSYYAFPFMFASLWPLIGLLMQCQGTSRGRSAVEPVFGFVLVTAASFVPSQFLHNPTHMSLPADFLSPPDMVRQASTDRALAQIARTKALGMQLVDGSVLALVPELYGPRNILSSQAHAPPDSVIYFAGGFESGLAKATAARAGLDRLYAIRGTAIRIATGHPVRGIDGLREAARRP